MEHPELDTHVAGIDLTMIHHHYRRKAVADRYNMAYWFAAGAQHQHRATGTATVPFVDPDRFARHHALEARKYYAQEVCSLVGIEPAYREYANLPHDQRVSTNDWTRDNEE